jgi:hypothetical protein
MYALIVFSCLTSKVSFSYIDLLRLYWYVVQMSSERIEHNLQMSGPTAQLHSGIQQAREYEGT